MPFIDMPAAPGIVAAARRAAQAQAGPQNGQAPRWYSISNAADPNEAEVLLYDVIGGWFGIYADEFLDELRQVTAPKIRLRINSPGGSVFEGIAIANALRAHPATVTVQVDGIAASIASVIAMAGDRIEMAPNSMLMIHEASGACMGPASEMTKMADVLDIISANIANAYAARSGSDAATWREAMLAETWYAPDDAVAAGLADAALSAVPESPNEPEPEEPDQDDEDEELLAARMHAQFDLAAYGYNGPPKPERPKPTPPAAPSPAAEAQPTALTIQLGDALGSDLVTMLRKAVAQDSSLQPSGTGPQDEDDAAGPEAPPVAPVPAAADEQTEPGEPQAAADPWAEHIARLTTAKPDPWAADIARLTGPASSRATES